MPWQPPPPAPAKRSNTPIILVILAVTLLLCGGTITAGVLVVRMVADRTEEALEPITNPSIPAFPTELPDIPALPTELPTDLPAVPGSGAEITVGYAVSGDGPVDIIYLERLGEMPKQLTDVKLPWKTTVTMSGSTLVSLTAVRKSSGSGSIECTATVDGKQAAKSSREGPYATAVCSKMVLE